MGPSLIIGPCHAGPCGACCRCRLGEARAHQSRNVRVLRFMFTLTASIRNADAIDMRAPMRP